VILYHNFNSSIYFRRFPLLKRQPTAMPSPLKRKLTVMPSPPRRHLPLTVMPLLPKRRKRQ
jgi:hypothetical protein